MSHAAIDKNLVLKACENFLNQRKARIQREQEVLIKKTMEGWWKTLTRQQAIAKLESGDPLCSKWHNISHRGWGQLDRVEDMHALASRTEKEVFVDDDMMWLFRSFEGGVV